MYCMYKKFHLERNAFKNIFLRDEFRLDQIIIEIEDYVHEML